MIASRRPYAPGDECVLFRPEDEAECHANGGGGCAEAIAQCYRLGGEIDVCLSPRTGHPFAFFGMTEIDDLQGCVWMLATPEMERSARSVAYWTPRVLQEWHARRPLLTNYVDARNALHIQWLRRFGFSFIALHQHFGTQRLPFYEFVRLHHV